MFVIPYNNACDEIKQCTAYACVASASWSTSLRATAIANLCGVRVTSNFFVVRKENWPGVLRSNREMACRDLTYAWTAQLWLASMRLHGALNPTLQLKESQEGLLGILGFFSHAGRLVHYTFHMMRPACGSRLLRWWTVHANVPVTEKVLYFCLGQWQISFNALCLKSGDFHLFYTSTWIS